MEGNLPMGMIRGGYVNYYLLYSIEKRDTKLRDTKDEKEWLRIKDLELQRELVKSEIFRMKNYKPKKTTTKKKKKL